jgi:hypothetical protein
MEPVSICPLMSRAATKNSANVALQWRNSFNSYLHQPGFVCRPGESIDYMPNVQNLINFIYIK